MSRKSFSVRSLLTLFFALAALLGPASSLGTTAECLEFNINVHLGYEANPTESRALEFYDPNSQYFILGRGLMGGSVYRVVPSNGKPAYVLKQYRGEYMRTRDELAFAKLNQQIPPQKEIEIVRPEILGKYSMKLPNIEGVNLQKAMEDPKLSKSQKAQLTQAWNQFIKKASSTLSNDPHAASPELNTHRELHSFSVRFSENGQDFNVLLKPDNVIVETKTGRMYVVDPF
jgi:hypothetical protein